MQSVAEIRNRIKGLLVRELDRRLQLSVTRLPHKCAHNHRQPLDHRQTVDGEPNETYNRISKRSLPVANHIGLCMLGSDSPEDWLGTICEDPIDAQKCPVFTPSQSKEDILAEFQEQLKDPAWVEDSLPEVASLLWALGEAQEVSLPWWTRVWVWLARIRPAPLVQVSSALALLPDTEVSDVST